MRGTDLHLLLLRRARSKGVDDFLQTPLLHVFGDVVDLVSLPRRALAFAVSEHERLFVSDRAHQTHGVLVIVLGLAAKAADDIRGDGAPRNHRLDAIDEGKVRLARVPTRHALQGSRRPALRGHVQALRHVGSIANHSQDVVGEILRVRRRETNAHLGIHARDFIEQLGELNRPRSLALGIVPTREAIGVADERATARARQTFRRRVRELGDRVFGFASQ
mmetsp:Transcript_6871/g.27624  ORF Transcript_6871/g.27624 Transcript_6871/m.27624 type:complete len:220 (-) Transcript_6871:742-1401(-)